MGKKLFDEGDKVQVSVDGKNKIASIVQYDVQAKKVIVKYEGDKEFDQTWLPVKNVLKLDKDNKPIKRDRSTSRGRNPSPAKTKKSPAKPPSSRTRSKSRDRTKTDPGAAGDARLNPPKVNGVSADFSSADEEALEADGPERVSGTGRGRPTKKKVATPAKKKTKSKSPTKEADLKDPEFSADDEPEHDAEKLTTEEKNDFVNNLIEKNSQTEQASNDPATDAKPKCSLSACLQTANCSITNFLTCLCSTAKSGAIQSYNYFKIFINLVILVVKLIFNNLPMVLSWYIGNVIILFLIDKKNVKLSQFSRDNFVLPDVKEHMKMEWTWLSYDLEVWILNLTSLWSVLKIPFLMTAAFHTITYLKDSVYPGYKMIIGSAPRITTRTNLRKIWLTYMVVAVFVMYYSNIMSFLDSKFPEILVNPITPYFRSAFTFVVGQLYAALTSIFLSSKSFYFSLVLLASFKSYHDHEFDLAKNWKSWFLNDEMSTSFTSRFNVSFGLEMFSQIAYLVLAVKNPNNKYLWLLVNLNFIQGYLATRSTDIREGHSAEGISVRRHYQGTMVSGFWFYYYNIYKLFTVMSFWRFINKPKNMTDCPYQLGAFVVLILGSGILKYFSNINFPSEKRFGIHGKIRNAERLSEILHVMALLCLCNFSFGNAPLVTSAVYFLFQILDLHIAEECAINRSPSKWKTYFSKVSYRIVPKVY